jgi:hypothetical protein
MDKQLLDALGNLSDALEIMAGVLQNKKGEIKYNHYQCVSEW